MPDLPITESPETRIDEPAGSLEALSAVSDATGIQEVAARYPECLAAWAALGDDALSRGRAVEAYAYFRVGYHRGLDRLRKAGWRGSGETPWSHAGNRGFLRALGGLGRAAEVIGEKEEETRCAEFLAQLAPDAPHDLTAT
jgi:hypothetical protein